MVTIRLALNRYSLFRWRSKTVNVYSVNGRSARPDRPNNCVPDVVLDSRTPDVIDASLSSPKLTRNFPVPDPQTKTKNANVSKKNQDEKNIFTQLSLIVVVFMFGYLPFSIYTIWTTAITSKPDPSFDYWFGVLSYLCLRISECLNPVMYNLGSQNIRRETKRLLKLD